MPIKNLKNLNTPKYRISIASVIIIGGGLMYYGAKSFGPNVSEDDKSRVNDGNVRLDVSALRAGRNLESTHIDDYEIDSSSEMARVHQQRREDERLRALEGDDSFVFTIAGSRDDQKKEVEKSPKPSVSMEKESEVLEEEVNMEAPVVVSLQEQLRNTQVKKKEEESKVIDPMPIQRQHYQRSNNQQQIQQGLSEDILKRSAFKFNHSNIRLNDDYSGSSITSRSPEIRENYEVNESVTEERLDGSNSYAKYMGLQETSLQGSALKVNAGDIFYTRLQIGINTDEISPVRAEIISGPLAGAVLLGTPRRTGEKAIIELSKMSFEGRTHGIDAVALDLDTQRTGMADQVDRHYARNMAYLTITSILSGYANSLQSWEETNTSGINSETTKRQNRLDSFDDRLVVGIGEGASELKDIFRDQVNREPTVHVLPQDIAIMFMSELVIGEG